MRRDVLVPETPEAGLLLADIEALALRSYRRGYKAGVESQDDDVHALVEAHERRMRELGIRHEKQIQSALANGQRLLGERIYKALAEPIRVIAEQEASALQFGNDLDALGSDQAGERARLLAAKLGVVLGDLREIFGAARPS